MNSNIRMKVISAVVATAALAGCQQAGANAQTPAAPGVAATDIAQDVICETKNLRQVDNCKPGQKIVFLPNSWGNQQLPVLFAGLNCDLRYQVVLTDGAVACIFRPSNPAAQQAPAEAAPASGK
ncbi:hypothetical protein D187_004017 [Cystobacter fuscus DSM 2262]|uniref:Lipoprotein n=1 Tax=Cystobacter fuscus (strain ATCC 25194 / DSM 2262 / NBRC 100088 / M29) TaxID=1242864 RepID=S9P263_CYSF2|nr:hypothetical protein [Cystobacter fuscus]EPX58545.1 hypothetical protein D187_004017 [Cystobacter fuscus DSM 2262]